MRRLLLLRHATAERAIAGQRDHERALTKGGRKEAKSIGRTIAARGEAIDLVLSSDSQRTRETWEGVVAKLKGTPETRFLRSLFEAGNYVPVIRAEGGSAKTLLIVGHNPAMHATATALAEDLAGRDGARLRAGFPKAALAILDFDGEWVTLQPDSMRLVAFLEADTD